MTTTYCDKHRHVYFLNGVPLTAAFTVNVNWNGKTPGAITFVTTGGTVSGPQYTRSFDVGAFRVGDKITVTAVASDGVESLPVTGNCDIIPGPPILGSRLYYVPGQTVNYKTPSFDLDVFKGQKGVVEGVPLPEETMDIQPTFRAEASVDGSGVLIIKAAEGNENKIKLNGTQGRRPDGKFGRAAVAGRRIVHHSGIRKVHHPETVEL